MHSFHMSHKVAMSPHPCVLFVGTQWADFGFPGLIGVRSPAVRPALGLDEVVL